MKFKIIADIETEETLKALVAELAESEEAEISSKEVSEIVARRLNMLKIAAERGMNVIPAKEYLLEQIRKIAGTDKNSKLKQELQKAYNRAENLFHIFRPNEDFFPLPLDDETKLKKMALQVQLQGIKRPSNPYKALIAYFNMVTDRFKVIQKRFNPDNEVTRVISGAEVTLDFDDGPVNAIIRTVAKNGRITFYEKKGESDPEKVFPVERQ